MSVKPTILKLGGSVITRKEKPLTSNLTAMGRLSQEISWARVSHLVLVHGGGSFGHPVAKQYAVKEGYKSPSQTLGFSKTHQAMVALNKLLVDTLVQRDIPAVGLQPSSFVITKSGRIQVMEEQPLKRLLELGFVPVLYGDAVLDSDLGFTILSGDQLTASLAIRLSAGRIIMGIDVDGLYTTDPKTDSSARLIGHATLPKLKVLLQRLGEAGVTDVTGGMFGKIQEILPAVEMGIPALIVNAAKSNNIYKALKGEKVVCTLIERG